MSSRIGTTAVVLAAFAGVALGQSATVNVTAPSTTVAAGETVTVTVNASYNLAGAGSGVFGSAGLFGFGGDATSSGTAAVTAAAPMLNADLAFGPTIALGDASLVRGAAGRGLAGGLAANPASLMTFDLTIDPAAQTGDTVTIGFDGAVVLVRGDALNTFSTNPGVNQGTLTVNDLTLTVGAANCSPADLAEPLGALDIFDILAFFNLFGAQDPSSDFAAPFGTYDIFDILGFFGVFGSGC